MPKYKIFFKVKGKKYGTDRIFTAKDKADARKKIKKRFKHPIKIFHIVNVKHLGDYFEVHSKRKRKRW